MKLNFVETIEGKEWVAEFEVTSDFNLHLERVHGGSLVVSQRVLLAVNMLLPLQKACMKDELSLTTTSVHWFILSGLK